MANIAPEWQGLYELEPLFDLPEVDLSVSIRSYYVHNPRLHRVFRTLSASIFTFAGYMVYLIIGVAVFVVPAPTGRLLAIVGVLTGMLAALLSVSNLRLELVRVLIKTYDIWFFTTVSTVVAVVLGVLLRDCRSMLMVMSWVSYLTNIFIDASVVGLRRLWIANIFAMGCYLLMAFTVSMSITDDLVLFNIVQLNGHALPAVGVFRDGIMSMVIVILRNLFRKHRDITKPSRVATEAGATVECVSFRCRLRVKAIDDQLQQLRVLPTEPNASRGAISTANSTAKKTTRLRFRPFLEPMDPRDTCLAVRSLLSIVAAHPRSFISLGIAGFVLTRVAIVTGLLMPSLGFHWQLQLVATVGAFGSVVFVSVCLAATHRSLGVAVITSFDFAFIVAQCMVAIVSILDLFHWQPALMIAFVGEGFWCAGLLLWDALLPPTRALLKLTPRHAAYAGTVMGLTMMVSVVSTFVWLEPQEINDRALWHTEVAGQQLQFRPLSWYASCLATIIVWGIRMVWRLWRAGDTELVILDGPVVYQVVKARSGAKQTTRNENELPPHTVTVES